MAAILDSSGAPMRAAPTSSPVPMNDTLAMAVRGAAAYGSSGYANGYLHSAFGRVMAMTAYRCSGLLRKVIRIPAHDRVREWRDWMGANDAQTIALEAEERRLGIVGKVKQAEMLRGLCGGALILALPGDPASPVGVVGKNALQAVNVVSRYQLTLVNIDRNLTSPAYGEPEFFEVSDGATTTRIHPSRIIAFKGDPLPAGTAGVSAEDEYWGDCRLDQVFREVQRSDDTMGWFSALVKKAKLLRIGIPGIADILASPGGQQKLDARVRLMAEGESIMNASVFDAGNGEKGGGEVISDYQVTWAGIPAVGDMFDQRVAAVANIPFTILMGRSPGGMNATGDHDRQNWNREVKAAQKLELGPCIDKLDEVLIPSALGSRPDGLWWQWAPLDTPTEAEEATRFKTIAEGLDKIAALNCMPSEAFNEAAQNTLMENGFMPGLDAALAKIPDEERFGTAPDDDGEDPSALQANGGDRDLAGAGGDREVSPPRRAANDAATWLADATPRPLYVQRKLLNAAELIKWARDNGFTSTLPASDLHVTILYSRTEVDPMKMGRDWSENEKGQIIVRPGGPRMVEKLGESAVVLRFTSPDLEWRHRHMVEAGGSHDYPEYQPHVTLTYAVPEGLDLDALKPFTGELRFGPEIFEALDLNWKSKVVEA